MKEIILSQGPIRYRDDGSGPVLLFVHGALVDGDLWRDAARQLRGQHRCIVPDWPLGAHDVAMKPGADLSPRGVARLVGELIERLDLNDVTLIGNDTGGAICQLVMVHHPERLAGVVLTNCDAFEVFPPRAFRYFSLLPKVPGLLAVVAKELHLLPALARLPTAFGRLSRARISNDQIRAWLRPAARRPDVRRDLAKLLNGITAEVTLDAAKRFADVELPVLLLWGDADPFFRLSLAQRLKEALPHSELATVDGARTFVSLDQPERVATEIRDFVARSAKGPHSRPTLRSA